MEDIFSNAGAQRMIDRLENLEPEMTPKWGKMTADQMLAHCNVPYDMTFTDQYARPNAVVRFFIRIFAKPTVVGPKPYGKNSRTAPEFVIKDRRDFNAEREKLINYLRQTAELGAEAFDGRESHAMGKLSVQEWNTLFAKHLDHHLTQFGV